MKSISDDDLCSDCKHCQYDPGEMSDCVKDWPGEIAQSGPREGYIVSCEFFIPIAKQGDNWVSKSDD